MSEENPLTFTLGQHPWGEEIVPLCYYLEEAMNEEHIEVPVSEEMGECLWNLLRKTSLDFKVKWGKPAISSEEKYFIEVPYTKFIFVIKRQDVQEFKKAGIEVELTSKEKFEKMSDEKFELLVEGSKFYAYFLFEEKYHIKFEIDVSNQTEAIYWVDFLNKNNQWLHWDNYEDGLGEYINIEESRRAHPSDRIPVIVERGRRIPYGFKRCPFFDREAFFSRVLDFIRDEKPEYEEYEETLRPYEGVYEIPF